jgi:hypothetical protein
MRDLSMDEDDRWPEEQVAIVERLRSVGRELLVTLRMHAPDEFVEPERQPAAAARAIRAQSKVVSEPSGPKEALASASPSVPPNPWANCPVFVKDELLEKGRSLSLLERDIRLARCVSCLQVFLTSNLSSKGAYPWCVCSPKCHDAHEDALREEAKNRENAKKFGGAS